MFYLSLDPGETIGWAKHDEVSGYASGQVAQRDLWSFLETYRLARIGTVVPIGIVLIYEKFDRRTTAADLVAVECIGVIKEWQRQTRGARLEEQSASMAKFFWSDERLKSLELYRVGKPHANDALRHLCYYLHFSKRGPRWALELPRTAELP